MKKPVFILLLITGLSLAGCTMGPNFQKPDVQLPEKFRFADAQADAAVDLKWWELFDDPALNLLVKTALAGNKDVMIAASRIEEARHSYGFTRADAYPGLDIQGGAERGNFAGGRKISTGNNFFIAPVLSWEIDFWGKFQRATEAARADLMAAEYALRTVQIGLISEVVSTYFLLLDYNQRLEISRRTLDSRRESLDIIQKRFSKGIIPEIDLNQAQIQKEITAAAIPVYERLISKAENTLSILLGKFPGCIEKGAALHRQGQPPDIPGGLPSTLLERRPDIVRARYLLEAQTARIGVAEALRFPSISLTGVLGFADNELSDLLSDGDVWSVGGSLFGPLFNFNKDKMRVLVQEEKTKQALLLYQNTILNAFKDVEDALNEIQTYKRQLAAKQRQFKAADNAAFLSKSRYDNGITSYLEVLDAERTLFAVGLELSETKQQYYNAYVKIYKALGGGWLSKEEMESAGRNTNP